MRHGPSNSTTLWRVHFSCSNSAATRPISDVATIGTGLSSGSRKLGITPLSRAGATSQLEFSINHPGRRNVMGAESCWSACSMMVCWLSKLVWVACAPMVDRYTTFPGLAASIATLRLAAVACASLKSGEGSKFGGTRTKAASAPSNAFASAAAWLSSLAPTHSQAASRLRPWRRRAQPGQIALLPEESALLRRQRCQ